MRRNDFIRTSLKRDPIDLLSELGIEVEHQEIRNAIRKHCEGRRLTHAEELQVSQIRAQVMKLERTFMDTIPEGITRQHKEVMRRIKARRLPGSETAAGLPAAIKRKLIRH